MKFNGNIVLLVGGVGGAKLAYGLAHALPPEQLTIIVNTGDDFWHYGLRICPDLDTITYTLSGLVDKTNGWGVAGDTTTTLEALQRYGETPWFRLGDQDLATHMLRTHWLREGQRLTAIADRMTRALNIEPTVLPMTDAPVATMIGTVEYGELEFQEYFVKHRWQPAVTGIRLEGIEHAEISPETQKAIEAADAIIIGPSNPWLSINPILSIPGMRELLAGRDVPRLAVTPLIEGRAVKGPTVKIMKELLYTVSLESIVHYYREVINGFIYDERDSPPDSNGALRLCALDTLMLDEEKRITLAHAILSWLNEWE